MDVSLGGRVLQKLRGHDDEIQGISWSPISDGNDSAAAGEPSRGVSQFLKIMMSASVRPKLFGTRQLLEA